MGQGQGPVHVLLPLYWGREIVLTQHIQLISPYTVNQSTYGEWRKKATRENPTCFSQSGPKSKAVALLGESEAL